MRKAGPGKNLAFMDVCFGIPYHAAEHCLHRWQEEKNWEPYFFRISLAQYLITIFDQNERLYHKEVTVKTFSIALMPGDGIGPEILREGKKVMDAVAEVAGITWQWKEYPYGAEHWLKYRKGEPTLMREEEMAELGTHDAIYFGSVGDPRVPESVGQAGALLWMRFYFDQYINLRPAKLLKGVDVDHDWPTWRVMLPRYLGELA